jgi:sugar lactone lactonase YvrE
MNSRGIRSWSAIVVTTLCATAAVADELYVSNATPASVIKYDSAGTASPFLSGLSNPLGIALDALGNTYLASGDSILKFDQRGNRSVFATLPGRWPTQLVFSASGDLYVSEGPSSVYRFDRNGNGVLFANTNLHNPSGMAFDEAGNLYVANEGNGTITRYDGGVPTVLSNLGLAGPVGLAFDGEGSLFVSNHRNNTIVKITKLGVRSVFADATSGLSVPLDLQFDSRGFLYVVNFLGDSVTKFARDGTATPFITSGLNEPRFLAVRRAPVAHGQIERNVEGGYRISFQGNPGQQYTVEWRTEMSSDSAWQFLATRVADLRGSYSIVDKPPDGTTSRFYRAIIPPETSFEQR